MTANLSVRLKDLLIEHSTRYPHLQAQDVYKFIYQAAMGNGHTFMDSTRSRIGLEMEIRTLIPDASQPLLEQISPESNLHLKVIRVNLRPYMAVTNNMDPLLESFACTANEFVSSTQRLEQYASLICHLPDQTGLQFLINEFNKFFSEMQTRGYPSIHHSEIYSRHYQPAYRVVAARWITQLLDNCREIG
ncbi:MAG: hypothetical protein ABIJ65_02155 [Chloroflexota bacterium]